METKINYFEEAIVRDTALYYEIFQTTSTTFSRTMTNKHTAARAVTEAEGIKLG